MTFDETMKALKAAGTAHNRKVYTRHGAREPMFGVSYAHLYATQKKIGTDHALTRRALATAKKIGKVEVDHGETGCKTPDAAAYIQKTLAYRKKKAAKAGKKKPVTVKKKSTRAALRPRR